MVLGEKPKGKMGKKVTTRWKEHWWKGQLVSPVCPGLAGTGTGMGISCSAVAFPAGLTKHPALNRLPALSVTWYTRTEAANPRRDDVHPSSQPQR